VENNIWEPTNRYLIDHNIKLEAPKPDYNGACFLAYLLKHGYRYPLKYCIEDFGVCFDVETVVNYWNTKRVEFLIKKFNRPVNFDVIWVDGKGNDKDVVLGDKNWAERWSIEYRVYRGHHGELIDPHIYDQD
jgi:hypothetical protein